MAEGLPGRVQHPPDAWALFRAVAVPAALPVPPAWLREEEARYLGGLELPMLDHADSCSVVLRWALTPPGSEVW